MHWALPTADGLVFHEITFQRYPLGVCWTDAVSLLPLVVWLCPGGCLPFVLNLTCLTFHKGFHGCSHSQEHVPFSGRMWECVLVKMCWAECVGKAGARCFFVLVAWSWNIKGDTKGSSELAWKCADILIGRLCVVVLWLFWATEVLLCFPSSVSSWGYGHVGLLFATEEHRKVLWCNVHFCHILQPCSWQTEAFSRKMSVPTAMFLWLSSDIV